MAFKTFGQLKVRKAGSDEQPIVLTFIDANVMQKAAWECRKQGLEIVDNSPGYKLYRTVEEAMESVKIWCR